MRTINKTEAGAFVLESQMLGRSVEETVAAARAAQWASPAHTPTVRRLIKVMAKRAEEGARIAAEAAQRAAARLAEEKKRAAALPDEELAALRARAAALPAGKRGKAARERFKKALAAKGLSPEALNS